MTRAEIAAGPITVASKPPQNEADADFEEKLIRLINFVEDGRDAKHRQDDTLDRSDV